MAKLKIDNSQLESECIHVNSLLVISNLENEKLREENRELKKKLSLLEFEKTESGSKAEETINGKWKIYFFKSNLVNK